MTPMTLLLFVSGLCLLVAGAEALVRGASRLATAFGISPLVVGLTVVAYGTSAPEMAVSISSAMAGNSGADLAFGNVVGSNIFNVLFILGLSALVSPLDAAAQLVRVDVPILCGLSVAVLLMGLDGRIGTLDGWLLSAGALTYTGFLLVLSRRESEASQAEFAQEYGAANTPPSSTAKNLLLIAIGLAMLVFGSRWLVDGAVEMARVFGVSELIIGLTIVSAGTSLPEVATSLTAAVRGERDIAVGNVVGSCIFNLLAVLGFTAVVAPHGVNVASSAIAFDVPVMIATAIACLPIFFTGYRIGRWEGGLLFGYYVAYVMWLVLNAQDHAAITTFGLAFRWFVLPLTALTLAVVSWREWAQRRGARAAS